MMREEAEKTTTRMGKYELGRTLGEGNFGKVKYAKHVQTGKAFAVKILDRKRILELKMDDQIKREIGTLKLLRHPNVVRLHEVFASKTKIYMVLEFVDGGELFYKIERKGRLPESEGRKLFQQLIDAISYCHELGVYHRDLKPENVLIDRKGNIKISDFGLSALLQDIENDGLLHTTCGSPNYIAPEISKGKTKIPKWLSPGAHNFIQRILDPNPKTRINVVGIREDDWFNQQYTLIAPDDDEDISIDNNLFSTKEVNDDKQKLPTLNAFELIGMSSYLDLSGFFEKEDISERKIRFTSRNSPSNLFERIEGIITIMGFQVQKQHGKLKVMQLNNGSISLVCPRNPRSLLVFVEVFELTPSLSIVEVRKSYGDSSLYRELCRNISEDLGVCEQISETPPMMS